MLDQALALHREGRLAEAEEAYRAILVREPQNAEVGHQLGLLALDAGLPQHAVPVFEQVCLLAPDNAVFQFNLALAYWRTERPGEALVGFDRAIALQDDLFEAHLHRGLVLKALQQPEAALESFARAAALRPDAAVHNNRALILSELGRLEDALESFREALALEPDNAMAHSNCGFALIQLGRHGEAITCLAKAVALDPRNGELHYNHGDPLMFLGRLEEALGCYERALMLKPELANAHVNRGLVLTHLGRADEALESFDCAIALAPDLAAARIGRSGALAAAGRADEALAHNRELARIPAFQPEADFHSAFVLLRRGDWEEGWRFYEARRQVERRTESRVYPQPEWLGEGILAGKTLYVYGEQGLGDAIQFCRYLALARDAGAKVIFSPKDRTARLLKNVVDEILPWKTAPAAFDYHMPLLSMPLAFATCPDTIPANIPYLYAEAPVVEKWRRRIGDHSFKIGICWAGSLDPGLGMDRSFPLRQCAALAALPGVRLISLQKYDGMTELEDLPEGMAVETLGEDFDAGPDGFVDTAAAMMSLDLVISCDTAIAHLAGALGRPVWTALKHQPEWRWMLQEETTPWYPGMRLFRQSAPGDWTHVFAAMQVRLTAMLA